MIKNPFPLFCSGVVVKGFGRGSKQLGIPTANYSDNVINGLPKEVTTGVYYGWAQVDSGEVHKMVMSIGWNPYYKNEKKSMETHILHTYDEDFYGLTLKTCILAYIRPEKDFSSLDDLIATIKSDIALANEKLNCDEFLKFKNDPFFNVKTNGTIPFTVNGNSSVVNGHLNFKLNDI